MAGFHRDASDPKAIAIAESVMDAMGGWENWNQTRYLRWRFFGKRLHVWDKWSGRLRLEDEDLVVLMNVNTREGQAWRDGEALADDALGDALRHGYEAWINDAYWLVMPYKLKDSGVTLKYVGEEDMDDGRAADVLQLTFEDVGVTPENKYHVFVARDSGLVEAWSYFAKASDDTPKFTTPWANWTRHGSILLSADRGRYAHTDVAVFSSLPDSIFEDSGSVDWSRVQAQ